MVSSFLTNDDPRGPVILEAEAFSLVCVPGFHAVQGDDPLGDNGSSTTLAGCSVSACNFASFASEKVKRSKKTVCVTHENDQTTFSIWCTSKEVDRL
jgi:hypothetical protein